MSPTFMLLEPKGSVPLSQERYSSPKALHLEPRLELMGGQQF